ncbi:MAG: DUF4411 family protein [Planctomycetia bacterium]|nr:DUF4411 family protein [Planctomycetia bacterium]
MQTVDASSIIHAWDTYPIENFPRLWEWVAEQINDGELDICRVAYDAITRKIPDCDTWLKENGFRCSEITNAIAQEALRIKTILGIRQRYSPKGVDENDLLIIARASVDEIDLVSEERLQHQLPSEMAHWRIPAVCRHVDVGVNCVQFIEIIKQSGRELG